MKTALAALALAAGCDRGPPPIASCLSDLRGVYSADGKRWMILDQHHTLEVYPLFDDTTQTLPGLELGPRVIDLVRTGDALTGAVRRRYMRGTAHCFAKVPVRVTACSGDAIELVMSEPEPPLAWDTPCTWPRPGSSHVERWQRE